MSLELYIKMPIDYFMIEIANCDMTVGYSELRMWIEIKYIEIQKRCIKNGNLKMV